MPNEPTKDLLVNLNTLLKGIMSQIFYLRFSVFFMTKNGTHFEIFDNLVF